METPEIDFDICPGCGACYECGTGHTCCSIIHVTMIQTRPETRDHVTFDGYYRDVLQQEPPL